MFLNPYIIEADQPVKLRFLPLRDKKLEENQPIISLDILLKEDKVYILMGKPDNVPLSLHQHLKDICANLLKSLKIRFSGMKAEEDFQWYLLASEWDKLHFFKMVLNFEERNLRSIDLMPTDESPFNLRELECLGEKTREL